MGEHRVPPTTWPVVCVRFVYPGQRVMGRSRPCPPLYATPRDPTRKTLGGAVAKVAKALGTPLMPWQRLVADVAMEVDPRTGRLVYGEVVVTTPRQQGKT